MQKANLSVAIAHIGSWLLFLSLPVVFITSQSDNNAFGDIVLSPFYWLCLAFFIAVFYLHTYYLFPNLYRQQKRLLYFLSVALLFLSLLWIKPFDRLIGHWRTPLAQNGSSQPMQPPPPVRPFRGDQLPPPLPSADGYMPPIQPGDRLRQPLPQFGNRQPGNGNHIDIISIFMFIVIIAISISLDVSQRLQVTAGLAAKAEADKANAELFALKAQVNPHFLFNTLNNIYSLAVAGNENTAESIMKLSNIMRYVTDEAPENFVPLQKEADCIDDFIDLQRLRIGNKVTLAYTVAGTTKGRSIAPFILLTFIENTFKYGVRNKSGSHIVVQLSFSDDGIALFCSNPLPDIAATEARKGTGIANVKKRLDYLYPGRHTLSISSENDLYTVQLLIQDKR